MPRKNRHLLRLIRRRSREPHGANAISPASRSFVQASELGAADIAIEGTAALSRLAAAAQTEQCPPRRLISRRWSGGLAQRRSQSRLGEDQGYHHFADQRTLLGVPNLLLSVGSERPHTVLPAVRGAKMFADAPTDSLIARLSGSDRLLHPKPGNVQRRKKDQRQQGRDQQSTHDRVGHRSPKYRGCDRDHAEHRRYGGEHDGAEAGHRGLDHRIPYWLAFRTLVFDLIDEDHRIARDHPEQRQNAENGHEPERFLENEKRGDDPDQPHRNDAQDEEKTAEAVQLHHQDGDNDEQHQGNHREDRSLRLPALLDRPAYRN